MAQTTAELLIEQGEAQGFEIGYKKGLEEGREIGRKLARKKFAIEHILYLFHDRFNIQVEALLKPLLERIDDLQHLSQLVDAAAKVEDVKDFRQTLVSFLIEHILCLLNDRFNIQIEALLKPPLEKINDIKHLGQLMDAAAEAEHLENFMQTLASFQNGA